MAIQLSDRRVRCGGLQTHDEKWLSNANPSPRRSPPQAACSFCAALSPTLEKLPADDDATAASKSRPPTWKSACVQAQSRICRPARFALTACPMMAGLLKACTEDSSRLRRTCAKAFSPSDATLEVLGQESSDFPDVPRWEKERRSQWPAKI